MNVSYSNKWNITAYFPMGCKRSKGEERVTKLPARLHRKRLAHTSSPTRLFRYISKQFSSMFCESVSLKNRVCIKCNCICC